MQVHFLYAFGVDYCFYFFHSSVENSKSADFGTTKNPRKILKIQIPENLNYQSNFDDILKEYTHKFTLSRVRTADLGSIFEIKYTIFMPNATKEKEMIDKLRERNGNLPIFLLYEPEPEEF